MRNFTSQSGAKVSGNTDYANYPESELTHRIIGCSIEVHRALGPGYLECVYETALVHELRKQGMSVDRQKIVKVYYDGQEVGEHRIDLIVENKVVLELKSVEEVAKKHVAQVISTLKAAGAKVALLMKFNEVKLTDGIQRIVF